MKKATSILFAVILLFTLLPCAAAQSARIEIASREDLLRIADNPSGDYVLTADIDLSDAPWTPIAFCGRLDGAGHTVGNLTVRETGGETAETYDGNYHTYEASLAGLFSTVHDATIQDLRLLNADIRIETDRDCFLGAIAGYAAHTTIQNCTVTMRGYLTHTATDVGLGGLLGFSYDCLTDGCTVDAELVFADENREVLCEEFLGGVFACGFGTVKGCTVRTRGYADVYGYAHNGGVIGMFKLSKEKPKAPMYLRDTTVDAEIRFFEVTPSRRAYCKALIGEDNIKFCRLVRNREAHFVRAESREPVPQRPESCASPAYTEAVVAPTCTEWGYTTFTCTGCGYSFSDRYTLPRHTYEETVVPPTCTAPGKATRTCVLCGDVETEELPATGHVPGPWTVVSEAAIGAAGEEQIFCEVCGAVLETRAIPALPPIEDKPVQAASVVLNADTLSLHPGETVELSASVLPADAADRRVVFESADPGIAAVDEAGRVTAIDEGATEIFVLSADGGAKAVCSVTVTLTFFERLRRFFAFSWLRCA